MTQIPPPSPSSISATEAIHKNRTWFIISGLIYLLTGLAAILFPQIASVTIVQIIALLLIITGVASFCMAIFSKHETQRMMHGFLALFRIIVGILMLKDVLTSLAVFTLILAVLFLIEGALGILAAARLKDHKYWPWLLLNGIIALALGVIILARYPVAASWLIGLLYGVNAVFAGITLLLLGWGKMTPPHVSSQNLSSL